MGLDMYLSAKKHVSGWDHGTEDEKKKYRALVKLFDLPRGFRCAESPSGYIELNVAYWRKAYQIHAWFVANVQDGRDECQKADVSTEQLKELLDLCEQIKANPKKAPELLPTQSGFFFGGTEYDEYYMQDIEYTIDTIKKLLADPKFKDCYFEYHSSW